MLHRIKRLAGTAVVAGGLAAGAAALAWASDQGVHDLPEWHLHEMIAWALGLAALVSASFLLWVLRLRREIAARRQAQEGLHNSERQLAAIMHNASEGIVVAQDGYIRFCNPALERMIGHSSAELVTRPLVDFIHPEDRELIVDRHKRRLAGERVPSIYEFRLQHREGHPVWVEISTGIMEWEGRTASLSFLLDITERRTSGEQLRLAQHALDNAAFAIYWVGRGGVIQYANDEAARMLGYSREELLEMNMRDIDAQLPPEGATDFFELFGRSGGLVFETEHRTRTGALIPVEVHARATRLGSRELICGFVHDITQRRRSETALRESEQRFRSLFEDAPIGALVMDLEGRHVSVNRALTEMLGYSERALLGKRHLDVTHPEDKDACMMNARRSMVGECERYQLDKRYLRHDGSVMWGRFTVRLVRDDAGKPLYYLGMIEDITERVEARGH